MLLQNSTILITGGTGSFGHAFVQMTLEKYNPKKIIIFSRDEMKQWDMAKKFQDDDRIRFFIGDVRDKDRLLRAMDKVDFVVHAAATKIVPTAEYNPFECIKTNVIGGMNVIDACIDKGVKKSLLFLRIKLAAQLIYMELQSLPQTNYLLLETLMLASMDRDFLLLGMEM